MGVSANQSNSESGGAGWNDNYNTTNLNTNTQNKINENPWGPQADYLKGIFSQAQNLFGQGSEMGADERNAYQTGIDESSSGLDWVKNARNAATGVWDNIQAQQQAATGKFNNVVDGILGTTMGDMQGQAAEFANNNPFMEQAIGQSWDQANKMLGEQVGGAGGINHAAGMTGNMSSSRAGVAEGVARSEMANLGQQNELAIRQGAYDQGLGQANQMMGNRMGMAGMLEQNPIDAATVAQGRGAVDAGYQGMINNQLQQSLGYAAGGEGGSIDQGNAWGNLNNFYGIVGDQSWGRSGTNNSATTGTTNVHEYGDYYTPKSKSNSWGASVSST